LRDIHPAEPMAVFLPYAVVAFVVVAVFHAPVLAHCGAESDGFSRWTAGDEVADVDVLFVRVVSLHPFAFDFHRAAGTGKPDINGSERSDCGATDIDATVVAIATQVKKGVLPIAVSTASSRLPVFSLVPTS
jgi:hypothetical protein